MRQTFLCILNFGAALTIILTLLLHPGESKLNGTRSKTTRGANLDLEEECSTDEDCVSGFCCPSANIPKSGGKACRSMDCCAPSAPINPEEHTFEFQNKDYKLFIKDWRNWLEAQVECCKWDKNTGRLAFVNSDDLYDRVESVLIDVMKTKQRENTGPNLEIMADVEYTVFVDGSDIDAEFTYRSVFQGDTGEAFPRYWSQSAKDSPKLNCVGLKYYDDNFGKHKMNTVRCDLKQPFLCEKVK